MKERVLTVALQTNTKDSVALSISMNELDGLVNTARGEVVSRIVQRRPRPDAGYYIGRGKALEIGQICAANGIKTVVFDDELSPAQTKNLELIIKRKVIDRTRLILDIFAGRAKSREGQMQVELAQLNYMLPRLTGEGKKLSQQVGGIGTRGPGEKMLEIDQRKFRDKISHLKRDIDKVRLHRDLQREKRYSIPLPVVALVGYTNAGKSTLLNYLLKSDMTSASHKGAYVDDKLFTTLDPTTRRVKLPQGTQALFVDTVGFINKLPHNLVAAFRSTLEEALNANILIHLIDSSSPNCDMQIETVYSILKDLHKNHGGAEKNDDLPLNIINVYNKSDRLDQKHIKDLKENHVYAISARTGSGVSGLMAHIESLIHESLVITKFNVPYSRGDILSRIRQVGRVISERNLKNSVSMKVKIDIQNLGRIKKSLLPVKS